MPTSNDPMDISNDHDLLIELRTEVRGLREDVKSFQNDSKDRIVALEVSKLDKTVFQDALSQALPIRADHEKRIRGLERFSWVATGVIGLIQLGITAYLAWRR